MDHDHIETHNLIERYVLGRLPVDEQQRFEEHFAECEACLDELELTDDFRAALRTAVAEDTRVTAAAGLAAVLARWLRSPRAALLLVAMASVLTLPSLWLSLENQRLRQDLDSLSQPLADVPSYLLTLSRDQQAPTPELAISAADRWLTLAIEVGDEARYGALLKDDAGRIRWQQRDLEPNLWGVLQFTFPATLLPPGVYALDLERLDPELGSEPAGVYRFRLREESDSPAFSRARTGRAAASGS